MATPRDWRLDANLDVFGRVIDIGMLERLHGAIEQEIKASSSRIDQATSSDDEDYRQLVVAEECDFIEELLGIAFVAMQTYLTTVRTGLGRLLTASSDFGRPIRLTADRKIFEDGPPLRSDAPQTAIETINEVANYWKHRDEWEMGEETRDRRLAPVWNPSNREQRTIEIVKHIGMSPGSSGNLRTAAEALGVTDYGDLSVIRQELWRWARGIYQNASSELDRR